MTDSTPSLPPLLADYEVEAMAAEFIAEDWEPDRYYREMNLIAFSNALQVKARAALSSASTAVPAEIMRVVEELHTQDNRITDNPLFAVQQKRIVAGLDHDYADQWAWVRDGCDVDSEEASRLDALREAGKPTPDECRRVGYVEKWEFVTGCLTEQGCKDYIARNGHNLKEPRIYAYGSYRNAEFIALRKWLMSLRGAAAAVVAPADASLGAPVAQPAEVLFLVMAGGDSFQAEIVPESRLDDAYLLTQWCSLDDIDAEERESALAHFHDDDSWTHTEVTGHGERVQFNLNLEDGWVQVTRLPSTPPASPAAQPAEDAARFTLAEIADAAVYAEVPDSKFESMEIALLAARQEQSNGGGK